MMAKSCTSSPRNLNTEPPRRLLQRKLLRWYEAHARAFPWRVLPGKTPDPYKVWLAEIMLQQTITTTMTPYFVRFTKRFPTIKALARANINDVTALWAGLGYYARARNLHACAKLIVRDYGGRFPTDEKELRKLPGIGPYTAAAMGAIAFGRKSAVVDGNIARVLARLCAIDGEVSPQNAEIKASAEALTPARRAGDYAQALMDLGARICTPKAPACDACPCASLCGAYALGEPQRFGQKPRQPARPLRQGAAFWVARADAVLLRRRPASGLLGGMMEVPSSPFVEGAAPSPSDAPIAGLRWARLPGHVAHVFTHFRLELVVYRALGTKMPARLGASFKWVGMDEIHKTGLPTLMRKVARHAEGG